MQISARNTLKGTAEATELGEVNAGIVRDLEAGKFASAPVKSSDVTVGVD